MNGVRIDILSRLICAYRETKENPVKLETKVSTYIMHVGNIEHGIYKRCDIQKVDKRTGEVKISSHLVSIEYLE